LDQIEPRPGIELAKFCLDAQVATPPRSTKVDCVCFVDVLNYFEQPIEILKSYVGLLRSNGFFVTCHYIWPERVQSPPVPGAEMYTDMDAILEQEVVDVLLDSVTLISPMPGPPRRWHLKAFSPRRAP
jgi:SAM-dependent methyltransferase